MNSPYPARKQAGMLIMVGFSLFLLQGCKWIVIDINAQAVATPGECKGEMDGRPPTGALCSGTLSIPSEAAAGVYDNIQCNTGKICKNENSVCSIFGQVCDTKRAASGGSNPCECQCTSQPD